MWVVTQEGTNTLQLFAASCFEGVSLSQVISRMPPAITEWFAWWSRTPSSGCNLNWPKCEHLPLKAKLICQQLHLKTNTKQIHSEQSNHVCYLSLAPPSLHFGMKSVWHAQGVSSTHSSFLVPRDILQFAKHAISHLHSEVERACRGGCSAKPFF